MASKELIERLEALGVVGPQTLDAECVLARSCRRSDKGRVCTVDLTNFDSDPQVAYIEVTVNGKKIRQKKLIDGGSHETVVVELRDDVEYDNDYHSCKATVHDCCNRIIVTVIDDVYLDGGKASKKTGATGKTEDSEGYRPKNPDVQTPTPMPATKIITGKSSVNDSIVINGSMPVSIGQVELSCRDGGAPAIVRISVNGDDKFTTMIWADKEPATHEIQILPEMLSGSDKATISIGIYQDLDRIYCAKGEVPVTRIDASTPSPSNEDARSDLNIFSEMVQSDYIVDVHDVGRMDANGCITIAQLIVVNKEKRKIDLSYDVQFDGNTKQTNKATLIPGQSIVPVTVPQNDLFRDTEYQISVCVVMRDSDSKLICNPRRTVKVRSKFDMNLRHKTEMAARFTNPHAKCVMELLKEVNAGGISIDGYQNNGNNILKQTEAIYNKVCDRNIQYLSDVFTLSKEGEYYQRVRTPDKVYEDGDGNCIETSILFASLFESAGFYPVIAYPEGHAIPGIIVAASKQIEAGEPPAQVPENIRKRFPDKLITLKSESLGYESGFKITVLLLESTLARRKKGDIPVDNNLDFVVKTASDIMGEDTINRSRDGKPPAAYCSIDSYRRKHINPILM